MVAFTSLALATLAGCALASPISNMAVYPRDDDEALLKYLTEAKPEHFTFNPAEGMPTLEEMNITVADFFDPEFRAKHGLPDPRNKSPSPAHKARSALLEKRFDPYCLPINTVTHVNAAYACRDMLNARGTQDCRAYSHLPGTIMCDFTYAPDQWNSYRCVTYGTPGGDLFNSGSYCSDVARAVDWIIGNCRTNNPCNCGVAGRQAAWGNGDLIITVRSSFE